MMDLMGIMLCSSTKASALAFTNHQCAGLCRQHAVQQHKSVTSPALPGSRQGSITTVDTPAKSMHPADHRHTESPVPGLLLLQSSAAHSQTPRTLRTRPPHQCLQEQKKSEKAITMYQSTTEGKCGHQGTGMAPVVADTAIMKSR